MWLGHERGGGHQHAGSLQYCAATRRGSRRHVISPTWLLTPNELQLQTCLRLATKSPNSTSRDPIAVP